MKIFLKNLFFIKDHITLKVIKLFYFLGMVGLAGSLTIKLIQLIVTNPINNLGWIIFYVVAGCSSIILFRILCEFITIAFGVFDKLEEIRCAITGEKPKKTITDDFDMEKCCGTIGDKVKDLAHKAKEKADDAKSEDKKEEKAKDAKKDKKSEKK
ncbi:MAG: DUF4282 domain-containing protein [Alphaproteobacteria bacterium]|nr:DUF4282 domain-containing protein [Alphaproteobacteria bacterium]